MEIPIENLKAKMRGVELNNYQKGLALDEFEKLIAHTEALDEALQQYAVMQRSEQLFAFLEYCDNAGWIKNVDKKRIIEDYEKANNCA